MGVQLKELLSFSSFGPVLASGFSLPNLSPELAWVLAGFLPVFGMTIGKGGTMDDWTPPPVVDVEPDPPGPSWLFYAKATGDLIIKGALAIFHIGLLVPAMPFKDHYLGAIPGFGDFFDTFGLGDMTLGGMMGFVLTLFSIIVPCGLWYLALTSRVLEDPHGFFRESKVNRVVLTCVLVLYLGLLLLEISLIMARISAISAPPVFPGLQLDPPPNVFTMMVLSFLITAISFLMGWVTARLIIQVERGEI